MKKLNLFDEFKKQKLPVDGLGAVIGGKSHDTAKGGHTACACTGGDDGCCDSDTSDSDTVGNDC